MFNALRNTDGKATLMVGKTYIPVQIESIDTQPYSPTTFTGRMLDPYFKNGKGMKKTAAPDIYVGPFEIKDVIFNNPATIVLWGDGTKTVVKCQEDDVYSEEVGLALCFAKKALGNKSNYNNVFKKWVPEKEEEPVVVGIDPFSIKMRNIGENAKKSSNVLDEIRKILNRPITPDEV